MFSKIAFTLTIGNEGSLLALHEDNTVKNKVLVDKLKDQDKAQLNKIFQKHKSAPIYILLDNSEQTYTKKSYPSINRFDLKKIINRHIQQEFSIGEGEEDVIHNYITYKNSKIKKWECMYVSSTYFDEMDKWIDYILQDVANPIIGIYMLPIETVSLIKKLHIAQNEGKKGKKDQINEKITLLIIQNKVSGIRQVVFSNERIIFTRLTNYNYDSPNFIVEFEQDIFRTNEYLKRILPNLKIEDVEIINILPRNVLEKINKIKNTEVNFINYTPREAAEKIGYNKLIPKSSEFSDVLVSNSFIHSKKILKSVTKKIKSLTIFNSLSKVFLLINCVFLSLIVIFAIYIQIEQSQNHKKINKLSKEKIKVETNLQTVKEQVIGRQKDRTEENKDIEIDEIIEFGRFKESVEKNKAKPLEFIKKINFLSDKSVIVRTLRFDNNFTISKFSEEFKMQIGGLLNNPTGDVENLFKIYDEIILETNKQFPQYRVVSSELPKDIDFSKKYFEVPFTLTIRFK